jgi:hypothetical protein
VGGDDDAQSFTPGDAGGLAAFDADIERDQIAVKFVILNCASDCATVEAVGTGGYPPYSYEWDNGSTAATRTVCPVSSTSYHVSVSDTGTTGDNTRPPQSVRVPLPAYVLACTDAAAPGGPCAPGTFSGPWTGTGLLDASTDAAGTAPITTPISIALADSPDSAALLSPSAPLVLTWDIAAQWTADLSGGLDCATDTFRAEDPMATTTVAGVPAGTCDLTLIGQYTPTTASLSGTWTSNCANGDWAGTFNLTETP